ncbi:hypothetical protein [Streptomyces sp. NBC_01190]|uniref:hypothetical protein n=1 Tax=Streptomyces sp. NBC_01190 TaxID=2903767 RepID=UPI003870A64A|nr:hypothetical protein OG519_13170 [Streptomyces sp. NBC_01190]
MTVPRANWLGFLSDEERVPHGGEALVDRVRALLADPRPGPEDLFSAANLVALTLFRLGRLDEARAVCHSEIDYAGDRPDSALRPRLAALGLQPRINLLRIEGYAGDLDRALTGLAALEDVAAGRAVRSGGIDWSPGDLDADPALHRRLRTIARNVRVGDTCKILLRRGRHELLLSEASRFRALWPALTAAGLHQAAEAPWTVAPGRRSVPGPAGPRARTVQESRLAFVRELHTAAHEADTGRTAEAAESASRLAAGLPLLTGGRWASATTVPRWRAVLGAVFVRAGDERSGRALLLDALDAGRRAGDTALAGGAARWLDAAGVTIPAGPERPPDIESLLVVSGRLAARLGHRARQPRTGAGA